MKQKAGDAPEAEAMLKVVGVWGQSQAAATALQVSKQTPVLLKWAKRSQLLTVTRFELARETHHGFALRPKRDAVTTWLHCHVWTHQE